MVGTLYNAGAVALGAAVGLAFRGRLTDTGKDAAFLAAGLFTLGLGIRMVAGMQQPLAVFFACFVGILLGSALGVQRRLDALSSRWAGDSDGGLNDARMIAATTSSSSRAPRLYSSSRRRLNAFAMRL